MSAPTKKSLELFYDVISPYSWIAFEVLCRYKSKWNIDLKLRPSFLGGIMQGAGNQPPAMVLVRGKYMVKDLSRLAEFYKIPIVQPKDPAEFLFVKGSLSAMRYIMSIHMTEPRWTEPLSRELWLRGWSRGEDITEPESLLQAAKKVGISESVAKESLTKIKEDAVKTKLKENTATALEHGAFGAPTMLVEINNKKELVFGSDRFELVANMIGEKWLGPLAEESKL